MMNPLLPETICHRKMWHHRRIECIGYTREDGLWDVEAELVDTKGHDMSTGDRPLIRPGEPLHHFQLRITIDQELVIRHAQARTLAAPAQTCPQISAAYRQLEGLRIGSGFLAEVRKRFQGVDGCTHLTELVGPLATTALQTLAPVLAERERVERATTPAGMPMPWPKMVDSCHTYRSDGPAVRRKYPEAYTGS
jgi:hypothetical protein